jgi:hypothetical protein
MLCAVFDYATAVALARPATVNPCALAPQTNVSWICRRHSLTSQRTSRFARGAFDRPQATVIKPIVNAQARPNSFPTTESMPPRLRPSRARRAARAGLTAALDRRRARRLLHNWSEWRNGAVFDRTEEQTKLCDDTALSLLLGGPKRLRFADNRRHGYRTEVTPVE